MMGLRALRVARALGLPVERLAARYVDALGFDTEAFEPDMADEAKCREYAEKNERRFRSNPGKYVTGWLKAVRDMHLGSSRKLYDKVAASGVPVMFVWGDSDTIVPLDEVQDELRQFFPKAPVAILHGTGHGILIEHGDTVAHMAAGRFRAGKTGMRA
mmetsp:Transcript_39826/g.120283  ORF Transcript_39826/g.120283 Transcript_39826/m.120283 type:complete len:158 (-) Transcript_39826:76-549(-)